MYVKAEERRHGRKIYAIVLATLGKKEVAAEKSRLE